MKQKLHSLLPLSVMSGLAFTLSMPTASAATIVQETFSGSSSTSLVGTTTGDGNNWTGSTTIMADGSLSGSNYRSAYLSLGGAVSTGNVYTIDISYTDNGGTNGNEPLRVGLSVGNLDADGDTDGDQQRPDAPAFDLFFNADGAWRTYPDSTAGQVSESTISSWDLTAQIVLDTTDALDYKVSYFNGATQLGSTASLGSAIAFDTLWIGHERTNGDLYFNSITVTGPAIPEPSTIALLGFGGFALLRRRRK